MKTYTHVQSITASTWTVNHNFGENPACDTYVMTGGVLTKILPVRMEHIDSNTLRVTFSRSLSGQARVAAPGDGTRYSTTNPSGSDVINTAPRLYQEKLTIRNGQGGDVGVEGHLGASSFPYQYSAFGSNLQDATSYPFVTNATPADGTNIDVGTGRPQGNINIPPRPIDVLTARSSVLINTSASQYQIIDFWFVGYVTDKIWVTASAFNGVGGAFSVTVVIGATATAGQQYILTGSATGGTGAEQAFVAQRIIDAEYNEPAGPPAVQLDAFGGFQIYNFQPSPGYWFSYDSVGSLPFQISLAYSTGLQSNNSSDAVGYLTVDGYNGDFVLGGGTGASIDIQPMSVGTTKTIYDAFAGNINAAKLYFPMLTTDNIYLVAQTGGGDTLAPGTFTFVVGPDSSNGERYLMSWPQGDDAPGTQYFSLERLTDVGSR